MRALALLCLAVGAQAVVTIGITCTTLRVCAEYNPIAEYLTRELGERFLVVPLLNDMDTFAAAGNHSLDFMISNPTTFECVQVEFGAGGVLSLVRNVSNERVEFLGSGIVVLDARVDIQTLADIRGKRVATSRVTQLQGFQAQRGEFLAEGIPFFETPAQLQIADGGGDQLTSLITGWADVAFTGVNATTSAPPFRLLAARSDPRFPFPTSTKLYPEALMYWVGNATNDGLLRGVQSSLLALQEGDPVLQPSMMWYFRSAYDYGTARTLLTQLNTIESLPNGTLSCLRTEQLYSLITCEPGFVRVPDNELQATCQRRGLPCPPMSTCICSPCVPAPAAIAGVGVGAFAGIMVGVALALVGIVVLVVRRMWQRVPVIPWRTLDFRVSGAGSFFQRVSVTAESEADVLAIGRFGAVVHAKYQGAEVTIQRVCPRAARGKHPHLDMDALATARTTGALWWLGQCAADWLTVDTAYRRRVAVVESLSRLRHFNLLPVLGVCRGADGCEVLVVHQFCPGTLYGVLNNPTVRLREMTDMLMAIISDVAAAMCYLHHEARPARAGVTLHPTDLYITHEYRAMVRARHEPTRSESGSGLWYQSPQVLRGGRPDAAGDVYAFGMLLYEVLYGHEPFSERLGSEATEELFSALTDPLADEDPSVVIRPDTDVHGIMRHPILEELMKACWCQSADDRPSFQAICQQLDNQRPNVIEDAMRLAARSQRAVSEFLPAHIAEQLAATGTVEAREHPSVTLFMADIAGFTSISSRLHPRQVWNCLQWIATGGLPIGLTVGARRRWWTCSTASGRSWTRW